MLAAWRVYDYFRVLQYLAALFNLVLDPILLNINCLHLKTNSFMTVIILSISA